MLEKHWNNAPQPVGLCCVDSVTVSVNTAAIVADPRFLSSFLSLHLDRVCSTDLAPTIPDEQRIKIRRGGGYLSPRMSLHYSLPVNILRRLNGAQITSHYARPLLVLRIHLSSGSIWLSPVRTVDREMTSKTTSRTAIEISTGRFTV